MINPTIARSIANNSGLEANRSFRTMEVHIVSVSPDQTRAICKMPAGYGKANEVFEVRVILTPGLFAPINVGTYKGLLHGDPKSPIGVQLIQKTAPLPNVNNGISSSIYGTPGAKTQTEVDGRVEKDADNFQQGLNKQGYPKGQCVVVKPPKAVPKSFIGGISELIAESPEYTLDDEGAHVLVGEDEVRMIADSGNGMILSASTGITLQGKVNICSSLEDVRIGGAWRVNPIQKFQIPSTAVTPIPTFVWSPPGGGMLNNITKYMTQITSA